MNKLENMSDEQYLFGAFFIVSNRIDALLQREFSQFDITTKQWFLSIIIDNLFDNPPTIKEVANEMGSSHQNIKQIARKLEQKGLLILEKDKRDARMTRLKLTENGCEFWQKIRKEGTAFTRTVFKDIDKDELVVARRVMQKILLNINEIDTKNERFDKYE